MTDRSRGDTPSRAITPEAARRFLQREGRGRSGVDAVASNRWGRTEKGKAENTAMACYDRGNFTATACRDRRHRKAIFRGEDRQVFKDR